MKKQLRNLALAGLIITVVASPALSRPGGKCCKGAKAGKPCMYEGMEKKDLETMHTKRLETLSKELGLTEEQKAKVSALMQDKWEKMRKIRQEYRAKMETILTPEQIKKHEAMKKNRVGKCKMMEGK